MRQDSLRDVSGYCWGVWGQDSRVLSDEQAGACFPVPDWPGHAGLNPAADPALRHLHEGHKQRSPFAYGWQAVIAGEEQVNTG